MKLIRTVMLVGAAVLFVFSSVSRAGGGWIGTGGEIFKDSHNPWFLAKNTSEIKYCVQADASSLSINPDRLPTLIEMAFAYWIDEFKRVEKLTYATAPVGGDYKLVHQACDGHEDIRFQFGFGTLARKQIEFLQDPSKYLGISVRTDYDEIHLRGRGFVYIASDLGPNKYDASPGSAEKPWSHEGILYRVLIHEVGHIFGIPHVGDGIFRFVKTGPGSATYVSIMSESYPELLLKYPEANESLTPPPSFFGYLDKYDSCGLSDGAKKLFNLAGDWNCLGVRIPFSASNDLHTTAAEEKLGTLYAREEHSAVERPLGTLWIEDSQKDIGLDYRALVTVNVTDKQTVIELPKNYPLHYVLGPALLTFNISAKLKMTDGTVVPVVLTLDAGSWKLQGLVDNKIVSFF